jgi:O-antigen/teichoic acid export membrane protein
MAKSQSTRSDVLQLTIANVVESMIGLLIPVLLVRILDQNQYGQYRFFWLIANSMMLILPLGMSRSLLYFLPRSAPEERAAFVSQTVFYLAAVALPISVLLLVSPAWLPDRITSLTEPTWVLGIFVFLWIVSSLISVLPNADRNIRWQKWVIIATEVTRAIIVLSVAYVTRDLQAIFLSMVVFVGLQTVLLGYYIVTRYGIRLGWPTLRGFRRQLGYAVPFGLSGMLARSRNQVEQWIVALIFLPGFLAILSIAVSFNGILRMLRSAVGNVLLPKMSSTHAAGDVGRALDLNNRGNLVICFMIYPVVAYIWVFAEPLVAFLYTPAYLDAVPVIRIYSLTMIIMSVELATVLMIYEQGRFVAAVSASVLLGAAGLSYLGAITFGLPGVAAGSVIGTLVTRVVNYRRAAKMVGLRLSRLQDWRTLSSILAAAVVSGGVAGVLTEWIAGSAIPIVKLAVGMLSGAAAYALLVLLFRIEWIALCMLGRRAWPAAR